MGHRVSCPEFVGRGEELDRLGTVFDSVAGGRAATVLVGGDAGIGKTRLVEELAGRARRREPDALIATGVCVPVDGGGLAYGPVVGILRDIARQLGEAAAAEVLGPFVSGLVFGVPGLSTAVPLFSGSARIADELAKTRLFESILACLRGLAERSAVVLVFEDLQWADAASAELLGFLTRNLTDARVLLIGTYRSDELDRDHQLSPRLNELGRHPRATRLQLEGLDRDETAEMIGRILGHEPDWALVEAVWARSQGNAFFVEELTAARHSRSLSAELQGVIMSRVEGLSSESQQLLRLVATAGATADHQLLAAAGVLDTDALDRAVRETVGKQVLVVDEGRAGYRVPTRAAPRGGVRSGAPRRARPPAPSAGGGARRVWLVGPTDPGHRAAELAVHWWEAGEWGEALAASLTAADAAIEVWAFPVAHDHLERALAALDRLPASARPAPVDRLWLLEKASDVAYLADAGQRSVDLAQEAIDGADGSIDPSSVARLYALLGRNAWATGDSDAALDACRRAAALVPLEPPSVELARVLGQEARGLMLMSRFGESERRCREAMAVASAVDARAEYGHVCYTLGCCRALLGHHDEGVELVRQALAIAEELAIPDDLNRAYMGLSFLLVETGRLEEGASVVFDSAAIGDELWGLRLNGAAGNSVEALIRLGRLDDAEALLARVGERGVGTCTSAPSLLRATIAIRRGRFDEAARCLEVADALTAQLADVQLRGLFHMRSAELALLRGRPDDAYLAVEHALALAAGTDDETFRPEMYVLAVRCLADRFDDARANRRRFDADKARLLADGFVHDADRLVAAPAARGGRCTLRTEALASMSAAEKSRLHQSDPELWEAAADRWRAAGEPYPVAYCRWRQAEALLVTGAGRQQADQALQDAWQVSLDLGAGPLGERIENLAKRARIPLRDAEAGVPEATLQSTLASDLDITPREVEVLAQLAAGRTDREIAVLLYISKKTASVHVSNLLRKLDAANRIEAGRIGQAHGLG